jgi:hypothetical protein
VPPETAGDDLAASARKKMDWMVARLVVGRFAAA